VLTVAVAGARSPGYRPAAETVSRLGATDQPYAVEVRAAFVLYGLAVLAVAGRVAALAPAWVRRRVGALVRVSAAAAVVCGLAPKDPPGPAHTLASRVHVDAAIVGGMGIVVAMAVVGRWGRRPGDRRTATIAACVTCLLATAFGLCWGSPVYGIVERLLLAVPVLWIPLAARRSVGPGDAPGERHWVDDDLDPLGLEPAPVAVVEVAMVEVVEEHDQRCRADGRAEADRVDGAQAGVGDQHGQVGPDGGGEGGAVGIVGEGRAGPADGLDQPDVDSDRPVQLAQQVGHQRRRLAEEGGGHRRGHGHGVPAVAGAHLLGVLAGGHGEGVGVDVHVARPERLHRLAGGDGHAPRAELRQD
jgi:hypothetical protein